jgi:hypothetical protein
MQAVKNHALLQQVHLEAFLPFQTLSLVYDTVNKTTEKKTKLRKVF